MKIAIIGTGISGLSAAWMLNPFHDITVYERESYAGGHSRTRHVNVEGRSVPVDTGFIVFNKRNYPLLTGLFDHLKVPVIESDMSFGVSIDGHWLEYGSKGLFAQKKNLLRPKFWGMVFDILRFNTSASKYIDDTRKLTLLQALDEMKLGAWFRAYYLQAMGAAIWSCSVETILEFPAKTFLQFFKNHGLLTINDHPQWYTVDGGSQRYIEILTAPYRHKIRFNCGVKNVSRDGQSVTVQDEQGGQDIYDRVIFACHADQTLKILGDASEEERKILGAFRYQENKVVLHTDTDFMPKRKAAWASWIYLSEGRSDRKPVVSLSYWMNNLQNLGIETPVLVTLNPGKPPQLSRILDEHMFDHPVFTRETGEAQQKISSIQGFKNTWHCGAYQRYGFHEDGLLSAVNVVRGMGHDIPWS